MDDNNLNVEYQPIGRNGKVRLTLRFADGTSHTDKIDVAIATERAKFSRAARKGRKGIDAKALDAELNRIAGELVSKPKGNGDEGDDGAERGKPSHADLLVGLVGHAQVELFHTPGGHDSEGYATVPVDDHHETWPINSKAFRRWLSRLFFVKCDKVPSSQSLQDALTVIAGKAIHEGPEYPVAVRVAELNGAIYLDLADEHWRAVEIASGGWRVVNGCPIKFVRRRGMLALPVPVAGGSIEELRPLVNLPDQPAWILFVAWLVAAMRPGWPFSVLAVNGEQGSAKSTLCKMARAFIDPNQAPLRRPPKDERDLMIAATNGCIVAFDNLSGIAPTLSDALCCLATGGGFGTRELYSDNEEKLFDATRPVILNGIEDLATRPDLLDRSVTLTLPVIPDDQRQDEDSLWRRFREACPRILGLARYATR